MKLSKDPSDPLVEVMVTSNRMLTPGQMCKPVPFPNPMACHPSLFPAKDTPVSESDNQVLFFMPLVGNVTKDGIIL